ncbi:type IV pilus assembly protein PilM [Elusimicrobiota bacterium]
MAGLKDKLKGIDLKGIKDKLGGLISGPTDILGVDVGSHSVKIVQLLRTGGGIKLGAWGHVPIEAKADASPDEKKQQAINRLKALLIEKGLQNKPAATSISGNAVIVRYVKFPLLTKEELRATLPTEAEPFIPFDINDVQLSFHILSDLVEEGQKKMETVLVAAKKDSVQARVEMLQQAGLKPAIIDVDSFALENVFAETINPDERTGSILCLNMGHMVTNLSIIEEGVTRVVRDVFISGNTFTKAIAKALQCDAAKAEQAKQENGLLISAEDKEKALQAGNREALGVSQALAGVLKDLVSELHRSVDFYLSQGPERSIGRIVLSGGSARIKNLSRFLTGELKVPVTALNPLSFLEEIPADLPKDVLPALGIAVGLALRKHWDWK